ncbi:MAG: glucosamine-6-phosphate deaminase [Planctomycetota bacterium]
MRVVILDEKSDVDRRAGQILAQQIQTVPDSVLGLATGSTPVGAYNELLRIYEAGEVSFRDCTTFNLDEYVGLPPDHVQSYRHFMQEHLFGKADFEPTQCHLPCPNIAQLDESCEEYEARIDEAGGIDLQLLGIGTDGHIAFNEPGSSLASRTRVKALTQQTRTDNARFFESIDEVPKLAVTMGIATILEAEKILLLATGENKASAVRDTVEGPISASVPATALQLHPKATILLDKPAARLLARKDYYEQVEFIQRELEQNDALNHH